MSEFNFKSQVATSREQSERLLALGLKKETADMHWRLQPYYNDEGFDCGLEWSYNIGTFLQEDAYELFLDYIPAWSLGRLIEITLNETWNEVAFERDVNPYEQMIKGIEWLITEGYFSKEYLD